MADIDVVLEAKKALSLLRALQQPIAPLLRPPLQETMIEIKGLLKQYPPERPGQKYRRTGNLGRRWNYRTFANLYSVRAIIGNNAPYAPAVQGEATQAPVHQGRWRTVEQTMREEKDKVVERTNAALQKFLDANA